MQKDHIYADPLGHIQDFRFDTTVVDVFPDMISRSVPGYQTIIQTIGKLTERFQQADSQYYDLGCSLGAATLAMRRNITKSGCEVVGIDNSEAMVNRCTSHLHAFRSEVPARVELGDIRQTPLDNAAMVVSNFTMQFLPPEDRDALVQRIYASLKPGGIFVLSEKVVIPDPIPHELIIDLHHDFKRSNGYSELEISQKRTALENVMRPDSQQQHLTRLQKAGFEHVSFWFQCFNFCSLVAIKGSQA